MQVQVDALTRRFEALEEMASDLAQITDVEELLERIVRRAEMAVRAPRYVLAVSLPGDREPRVHYVGFGDKPSREAAQQALDLLNGEDAYDSRLVVDVSFADTCFGRLGAFFPHGHRFFRADRRLMTAYASHAAAALHGAAVMADLERQAATNAALFRLSAALADLNSSESIGSHLSRALPDLIACDRCMVMLFDSEARCLVEAPAHILDSGLAPLRLTIPGSLAQLLSMAPAQFLAGSQIPDLAKAFERLAGLSPFAG